MYTCNKISLLLGYGRWNSTSEVLRLFVYAPKIKSLLLLSITVVHWMGFSASELKSSNKKIDEGYWHCVQKCSSQLTIILTITIFVPLLYTH